MLTRASRSLRSLATRDQNTREATKRHSERKARRRSQRDTRGSTRSSTHHNIDRERLVRGNEFDKGPDSGDVTLDPPDMNVDYGQTLLDSNFKASFVNTEFQSVSALHPDNIATIITSRDHSRQRMTEQLFRARILEKGEMKPARSFIPHRQLIAICNFDAVLEEVRNHVQNREDGESLSFECARYVCGPREEPAYDHLSSARKIFAILVMMNNVGLIFDFLRGNIKDKHLPFRMDEECSVLLSANDPTMPPLMGFEDPWAISAFHEKQWAVHIPYFAFDPQTNRASHYRLDPQTILPWIEYPSIKESGGFGEVRRVKIHPDHHGFSSSSQAFALKTFYNRDFARSDYEKELHALRIVSPEPHLVELLASFESWADDKINSGLLFPWANGGSLRDLWSNDPPSLFNDFGPRDTEFLLKWLAMQAQGMMSGLKTIHRPAPLMSPNEAGVSRLYGIHGDLKPENILHFSQETQMHPFGMLKIADFGVVQFRSRATGTRQNQEWAGPGSPAYRSPEHDTVSKISRKVDIWAMGCVFSEMLTWALLGSGAVERYRDARLEDQTQPDDLGGLKEENFFCRIEGGGSDEQEATLSHMRKPSVDKWLSDLVRSYSAAREGNPPRFIVEFITFIKDRMLSPWWEARASCDDVIDFLAERLQAEHPRSYWGYEMMWVPVDKQASTLGISFRQSSRYLDVMNQRDISARWTMADLASHLTHIVHRGLNLGLDGIFEVMPSDAELIRAHLQSELQHFFYSAPINASGFLASLGSENMSWLISTISRMLVETVWSKTPRARSLSHTSPIVMTTDTTKGNSYEVTFGTGQLLSLTRDETLHYLENHPHLEPLILSCRLVLERYQSNKMALIARRMSSVLQSGNITETSDYCNVHFHVQWDIAGFLDAIGPGEHLKFLLCFVGRVDNAQLTTFGDYFQTVWPKYPLVVLEAIDEFVSNIRSSPSQGQVVQIGEATSVTIEGNGRSFIVDGPQDFIIAIGQQLAYLAAACNTTDDQVVMYSRVDFTNVVHDSSDQISVFNIKPNLERASHTEPRSCWTELLEGSVLVAGFPISQRPSEVTGIESELAIFASLLDIRQAITYQHGYVLKGRCHALVPVDESADIVRWHLISTLPKKLEWDQIDQKCHNRLKDTSAETLKRLQTHRAFLGWCGQVEHIVGTGSFFHSKIHCTDAATVSSQHFALTEIQIGISKIIHGKLKFSAQQAWKMSSRREPKVYEDLLEAASKVNVFLYDEKSRRATHVSGERLILQSIIDSYHPTTRGLDDRDIALHPGESLRSSMESKALLQLRRGFALDSDAQTMIYLKDVFKDFWVILDRLHTHVSEHPSSTWFHDGSRYIYGWEYLDFVEGTSTLHPKQVSLQKTCGSWPKFTRDPEVKGVFLLGNNFGNLLKPVGSHCPRYACIPEGRDYLGLPVSLLSGLYDRRGSSDKQQRLTRKLSWHRPSLLFEPCGSHRVASSGGGCECDRIQNFRLLGSDKFDSELIPPGTLEADGAAIFGENDGSRATQNATQNTIPNTIPNTSHVSCTGGPQVHPPLPVSTAGQPSTI